MTMQPLIHTLVVALATCTPSSSATLEGNGVVLSALYGRDATRIYAKPVEKWLSPKKLGEEEEEALAIARQSIVGQD